MVKETGVPGENHLPAVSHWQTLFHNIVSGFELTTLVVLSIDCIGSSSTIRSRPRRPPISYKMYIIS